MTVIRRMNCPALPRIGISAGLLGEEVRHDGGHKRDAYLVGILGEMVAWVPVCPDVELGLGTPREPIRLVRNQSDPSVVRLLSRSGLEITARMQRFTRRRVRELAKENLSGYIVKKDSPSCGMERVKIWKDEKRGESERKGRGLFTAELIRQFPNLPLEEEGRLYDSHLRENFFARVFAYRKIRSLFSGRWKIGDIVRLHTAQKLLLNGARTRPVPRAWPVSSRSKGDTAGRIFATL